MINIIVPFRDVDGSRTKQLEKFQNYMAAYLRDYDYKIYVIEQSADGKKFNRGKLLNIGFTLSAASATADFVCIFHDVDLLPSSHLLEWYVKPSAPDTSVHIAGVWKRYNSNPKYFGGITTFGTELFKKINGYPNNFWGWGGEDDELYLRMQEVGAKIIRPKTGYIIDMENMSLDEKLSVLKSSQAKFMLKYEALAEHSGTWRTNGLVDLSFKTLRKKSNGKKSCIYTVEL